MKKILDLNKKAWDKLAKTYDDREISPISNTFKEFIGLIPEKGHILDLGCGTGIPYARYMINNGYKVTGIDLSEEMIKTASRNVPEATFYQMSITEISYIEEFDAAVSSFSMLLLSPKMFKEAACKISKAIKGDGLFYLSLNEPSNSSENLDREAYVNIMGQDMYSRAYPVVEITNIFNENGFKQVSFHREIHHSTEFGEEHVIEFIFQKRQQCCARGS